MRTILKRLLRATLPVAMLAGLVSLTSPQAFAQKDGFTYNGMVYASWWYDEYGNYANPPVSSGAATTASDQLAQTKASYASVLVTQYVQTATSNTIAPDSSRTPLDNEVVFAIQTFHNLGLKVFLKPHVDCECSTWRGQFAPSNPSAWFSSFQTFIVHYAQIAQQNGVDGLVFGTEYKSLSGSAYYSYWSNIISQIRKVYSGSLAYGANATGPGDEYTTVSFWSLVDLIGVDGYFGLTTQQNPSVSQLVSAWSDSPENGGFNALSALQNLHNSYNKPVIFTELGYESTAGTNEQPWNSNLNNGYDPTEQANCYEAFFEVFSQQNSWMKGVFWWAWTIPALGSNDTGYDPNGKPAGASELPTWYGGSGGTLIANGTYIVTSVHSGMALEDPGYSTAEGEDMDQWGVNDGTNQQWKVNNLGNNVITLINVASGQALDVYQASKSPGAYVDQWPYSGGANQQWQVVSVGGGAYELVSVNSGLCLDVYGGGTSQGEKIDQYTYYGNPWQQWKFASY